MITENNLDQIKEFLNLEKISVIQKIIILCIPKIEDAEFYIKLEKVKDELKKFGPNVTIQIVSEGDIKDDSLIEVQS
jgi:hypothetical protein